MTEDKVKNLSQMCRSSPDENYCNWPNTYLSSYCYWSKSIEFFWQWMYFSIRIKTTMTIIIVLMYSIFIGWIIIIQASY